MCKISQGCLCNSLDVFIKSDRAGNFKMKDFLKKQGHPEIYTFFKNAFEIDCLRAPAELLKKADTLASIFLLEKVSTQGKQFVYQYKEDSICPDRETVERFTNYLTKVKSDHKLGKLEFTELGELKERLSNVVEHVRHHVFPQLLQDPQFHKAIMLLGSDADSTTIYKEGIKPFKNQQTSKTVDALMEELNIDVNEDNPNAKRGISISR